MLKKIINWFLGKSEEKEDLLEKLKESEEKELENVSLELVEKPKAKKRTTKRKTTTKKKGKTTKKDEVLKLLSRRKNPIKLEDVAKRVGVTTQTARRYLYYLKKEGKVDKKGDGWVKK